METITIEKGYFETNKPSIIDLYALDNLNYDTIINNIQKQTIFSNVEICDIKDNILHVKVTYKKNVFSIYLKITKNDNTDLNNISRVLIDEKAIEQANQSSAYLKSYVLAKHNYVAAYYAQIKLLSCLCDKPLLIVDCTQWCIYSDKYIKHFAKHKVDIIDSNLFKIKYSFAGSLYTEGLERFGIKDLEMSGITEENQKTCASFLSRLARYFIENGQLPNTCQVYSEVFESPFYACLIDIEFALEELSKRKLINVKKRPKFLNTNRLYVSVHQDDELKTWYQNDEEVLEYLNNNKTYYTSTKHFEDEKQLAQETIVKTINFLEEIDDTSNLMILARNEEISTDWYYFSRVENGKIILKTADESLVVSLKDIMNWNYRGIAPLYAYSLEV